MAAASRDDPVAASRRRPSAISPQVKVVDRQVQVESNALDAPNVVVHPAGRHGRHPVPRVVHRRRRPVTCSPRNGPTSTASPTARSTSPATSCSRASPAGRRGRADPEVAGVDRCPSPASAAQIRCGHRRGHPGHGHRLGRRRRHPGVAARPPEASPTRSSCVDTAERRPGPSDHRPDPQVPRHQAGLLRAVRLGDGDDGAGRGHPGTDGDRLPARHAAERRLHGALVRRPRLARAVLPRRRVAAVRADPGGPDRHARRPTPSPREAAATATATAHRHRPGSTARPDRGCATPEPPRPTAPPPTPRCPCRDRVAAWFQEPRNLVVLALVLGLLGTLVLPLTAWLVNRRRRRRELRRRRARRGPVGRAGVAPRRPRACTRPPAAAPCGSGAGTTCGRPTSRRRRRRARAVVTTLERSRYARPGAAGGTCSVTRDPAP